MKHTKQSRQESLVLEHLSCVHWTIRRYIHVNNSVCGLEYDDLYQEGCIALWRAAATYDRESAQFHSYAISVIRNHLLDYCRRIQRQSAPALPLEEQMMETGEDADGDLYVEQILDYGKRTYGGVARLGIEAIEWKIQGYTGADIAKLYHVKPNHVGAWISRAAAKLKKDGILVENSAIHP